jgi:hypothetical protein
VITGSHFLLFSRDASADRRFFREGIGFRAVDAGGGWLIFALPPAEAAFHPADAGSVEKHAGHPVLGAVPHLMCDNLSEQIQTPAGSDVVCSPTVKQRRGTRTSFRLPSGGEIGLYQPSHPTAV